MPAFALARPAAISLAAAMSANGSYVYEEAPPVVPTASAPGGFTLLSATTGTHPFTVGMAFEQGAITGGIVVTGATAQAKIKSTWPDGSAKFAVISGTAALTGGTPLAVTPAAGTSSTGTALTTAGLIATGITAEVGTSGTFGSASFGATEWAAPFESWVSGHLMSSWVYRKQIGTDPHLVAWLEVRFYASGAVEILPWVENGYLMVTGPTSKSATYTFAINGSTRFSAAIDLTHHSRTPLISGTATAHWLGADPDITVRHDGDYLQATGLVPAYSAKPADGSSRIAALPTSFTPLQQGSWPTTMGAGGYSPSIGLLPEWDVLYLTNGNATTYKAMIFNAFSAGRYAFHFRDESDSNRWARLSQHTTLQINRAPEFGYVTPPATSGTAPPVFSVSHQPSIGYLAYLATGRRYFLDEVQAAESHNSMSDPATQRNNGDGIVDSAQAGTIRRLAWILRNCAQAIAVTPDSDTTMLTEYRTRYAANVDWYHNKYVVTAPNAFGLVKPYEPAGSYGDSAVSGTTWLGAMWMQDFLTASWGYAKDLGLNLGTTPMSKLDALFAWKAQSIVGRLGAAGDATGANYRGFAPYNWALCPASANFDTGTGFYANWRAAFNATYGGSEANYTANNGPYTSFSDVDGNLLNYLGADFQVAEAMPAIAYAVKHGVTGADAAMTRLLNAGNYVELQAALDVQPVWAVTDAALPKWLRSLAVDTWVEIDGTSMYLDYPGPTNTAYDTDGGAAAGLPWLDSYNGVGADPLKNSLWQLANGGHGDSYGNDVIKLDLMADAPAWAEWMQGSSGNVVQTFAYSVANYPEGNFDPERARYLSDGINGRLPASAHSYWATQFIARHRRMFRGPGCSYSPSGTAFKDCEGFAVDGAQGANGWDVQYTYPGTFAGGYTAGVQGATVVIRPTMCRDPRTDCIYVMSAGGCRKFTPSTTGPTGSAASGGSWATFTSGGHTQGGSAVDTTRGKVFTMNGTTADAYLWDIDGAGGWTTVTMTGAAAATIAASPASDGWGVVYVPELDSFLAKRGTTDGAEIFKINASTYAVTVYAPTGGASVPQSNFIASNNANVYNRWQYLPKLRGVVYAPKNAANVWFLRTH